MWQRICGVLDEVMDLPRERRSAGLERSCAGSAELRRWVETLLDASDRAGDFLERPGWPEAVRWVRRILEESGPSRTSIPFRKVGKEGES